jgi:hypothetical protein
VPDDRRTWREDLDPKIPAIREMAAEFASVYMPLDGMCAAACCKAPAADFDELSRARKILFIGPVVDGYALDINLVDWQIANALAALPFPKPALEIDKK